MQINKETLQKLANIDEEILKNIIYSVAIANGASPMKARMIAGNARMIKNQLANATDRDIEQIVSIVGEDKAAEILNMISNKL